MKGEHLPIITGEFSSRRARWEGGRGRARVAGMAMGAGVGALTRRDRRREPERQAAGS